MNALRQGIFRAMFLVASLLCVLAQSTNSSPNTFEAFRFKSGMTPDAVSRVYPGYELRWLRETGSESGSAMLVKDEELFASLYFCHNGLVGLTRSIDPDTDLVRYISDALKEYGQPRLSTRSEPWTGTGGGDIQTVDLQWIREGVRYTISYSPEGRTGRGELRHFRHASVEYFLTSNACLKGK